MDPKILGYLVSQYGLTKSEAQFTGKLVEGKSVTAAGQESFMTAREVGITLNRVLLKVTNLFPVSCKQQGANRQTLPWRPHLRMAKCPGDDDPFPI